MVRRTVHIPDELDDRVQNFGDLKDSYSGIVQRALIEFLDKREQDIPADEAHAHS